MTEDVVAHNLDDAWRNFDPDQPLAGDSSFFVEYERRPLNKFKRALLRNPNRPMRFFLAGFRGSGKSSHLNRLAIDPDLKDRFLIAKYSIRDTCDFNDITTVDLMVSMASSIIASIPPDFDASSSPAKDMIDELLAWGSRIEEKVQTQGTGSEAGVETGAQVGGSIPLLGSLFTKITGKIRIEESSRKIIREVLEPQLTDLIEKLNRLADVVTMQTQRPLLVLVDDTDKLEHNFTNTIFHEGFPTLCNLNFHVLYTVREFTFFSPDFPEIKAGTQTADMLRNVELWKRGDRQQTESKGIDLLTQFVHNRMDPSMIEQTKAVERAAHYSGGIFRQLASIMQISLDHAIEQERERVEEEDVVFAANELRKGLMRIFTQQNMDDLEKVYLNNDHPDRGSITPLFLNLAILEYENGDFWYDVHPVLWAAFPENT